MKTAVFRADSSVDIGTGHLMRCLTLAQALRARDVECHFLSRDLKGNLNELVSEQGFDLHLLENDAPETVRGFAGALGADWLVVDHYGLDASWERLACPVTAKTVVIDDLADRPHECTLLLDQNLGRSAGDYDALIPPKTRQLFGLEYALLRPEFLKSRTQSMKARAVIGDIHVFLNFGGADPFGITAKVLGELAGQDQRPTQFTVVLGAAAQNVQNVQKLATKIGANMVVNAPDMAGLMAQADVAIGAAGSTAWERCCLGLPTGLVILADNQRMLAHAVQDAGAGIIVADLTRSDDVSGVPDFLRRCAEDRGFLSDMSTNAARLVDGRGAARVADAIVKLGGDDG